MTARLLTDIDGRRGKVAQVSPDRDKTFLPHPYKAAIFLNNEDCWHALRYILVGHSVFRAGQRHVAGDGADETMPNCAAS